jgi:hypothetical protein
MTSMCLPHLEFPLRQVKRVRLDDSWLKYDPASQQLAGTPTAPGVYTVSVLLDNGKIHEKFRVNVVPGVERVASIFAAVMQPPPSTARSLAFIIDHNTTETSHEDASIFDQDSASMTAEGEDPETTPRSSRPRTGPNPPALQALSQSTSREPVSLSRAKGQGSSGLWCLEREKK